MGELYSITPVNQQLNNSNNTPAVQHHNNNSTPAALGNFALFRHQMLQQLAEQKSAQSRTNMELSGTTAVSRANSFTSDTSQDSAVDTSSSPGGVVDNKEKQYQGNILNGGRKAGREVGRGGGRNGGGKGEGREG